MGLYKQPVIQSVWTKRLCTPLWSLSSVSVTLRSSDVWCVNGSFFGVGSFSCSVEPVHTTGFVNELDWIGSRLNNILTMLQVKRRKYGYWQFDNCIRVLFLINRILWKHTQSVALYVNYGVIDYSRLTLVLHVQLFSLDTTDQFVS